MSIESTPTEISALVNDVDPDRSSFIGRTAELEAIRALFERGARLLTIVGPAGMGKTRIARRYLRHAAEALEIHFCDLTGLEDEEALCSAIGQELDLLPESRAG